MEISDHSILEYLYVDKSRLESYFEQISDPVAYDKVPTWKVILGLTGPKTEASQMRSGRSYTRHEKINKFVHYVKNKNLLSEHPLKDPFSPHSQFTIESLTARLAHIEAREDIPNFKGLNIWVSTRREAPKDNRQNFIEVGCLFLIEDFFCKDDNIGGHRFSGYSSFELLIETLEEKDLYSVFSIEQNLKESNKLPHIFDEDPIKALSLMGAKVGPPRRVRALYRVRSACLSYGTVTIGYPIVIFEEADSATIGT